MAAFNNSADLVANTNTTLRTVTAGLTASFTASFANRNATPVMVKFAHACASAIPTNSEWKVYDVYIPENGVFEITGLIATSGKLIVAQSNTANVSVQIYGYED